MLENNLLLWAAAGSAFGGAVGNLLNPEFEAAFAYNLLVSSDTGRTWQHIVIPNLASGSLIFDIISLGDKLNVVSYQDSVTYVSTATILQTGQVLSSGPEAAWVDSYPNPVQLGQMIKVSLSSISDEVYFNMTDPLGRIVSRGKLSGGQIPTAGLRPGCFQVTYSTTDRVLGSSKVVIR